MQRKSSQRGAISFVSMLMLAGLAVAGYFGAMYGPAYFEAFEVKQMLREASNMAARLGTDDQIREFILNKSKQIGSHWEIVDGEERNIPGLVLLAEDVFVNRDDYAKTIVVQVKYTKRLDYPFLKRQKELTFSPSVKESTRPVHW